MSDDYNFLNDYTDMVGRLTKPGAAISDSMTPFGAHLIHMALGISGEAGELLDAIKKHVIYGKPLDISNVIEELGDLEFFMQSLRSSLKLTRGEVLQANRLKLEGGRYKSGTYSDDQAQARADKQ